MFKIINIVYEAITLERRPTPYVFSLVPIL